MRKILFWLGCILIFAGAVGLNFYIKYKLDQVEVVAVKKDIPENSPISSGMIYLRKIHRSDVLPQAVPDVESVLNKIAIMPMSTNEQILSWKISEPTDEKQLGFRSKLEADEIAVSLPVTLDKIGRDVRQGDRVNIIQLEQDMNTKAYFVERIFYDKEVLEVSNASADEISYMNSDEGNKSKIPRVLKIKIKKDEFEAFSIAKQGKVEICILGYQLEDGTDENIGSG